MNRREEIIQLLTECNRLLEERRKNIRETIELLNVAIKNLEQVNAKFDAALEKAAR